jgi:hypothetical protein
MATGVGLFTLHFFPRVFSLWLSSGKLELTPFAVCEVRLLQNTENQSHCYGGATGKQSCVRNFYY